jgi:VIT1/CCC1 family predicted Fe2+/Mn2+ transporter
MNGIKDAASSAAGGFAGVLPACAAELAWYAVISIGLVSMLLTDIVRGAGQGAREGLAVGVRAVILRRLRVEDPQVTPREPEETPPERS